MRRIFWGFCRNWFLMSTLHYLSGRSDFAFEFTEIFVFEKRLPAITDTGSRRLSVSVIRGGADSTYRWVGVSTTPCITDTQGRRLPASPIRRLGYWIFKKKTLCIDDTESRRLSAPVIRWVADSPYHWVGVDDSEYHRFGESTTPRIVESTTPRIGDRGSRYSKKNIIILWNCKFIRWISYAGTSTDGRFVYYVHIRRENFLWTIFSLLFSYHVPLLLNMYKLIFWHIL